ncbi:MAG: hypothetical protein L6V93_15940 [Clostridiales bacterium]|nr:MAG: hypothetical protein L6V93_15940 [Clostridiales bacterium]
MRGFFRLGDKNRLVQFVDGSFLQQKAVEQQTKDKVISSKRGTIYDRNMKALAQSASVDTVCATPREIAEGKKIPTRLRRTLRKFLI